MLISECGQSFAHAQRAMVPYQFNSSGYATAEHSIVKILDQWLNSGPQRQTWGDAADVWRIIGLQ